MKRGIWATLGIKRTNDRAEIRRAYAAKLRVTNPEDDPEGFMALRSAYEAALQGAWDVPEDAAVPDAADDSADGEADPDDEDDDFRQFVADSARWDAEVASATPPDPEIIDLNQRWQALVDTLFADPPEPVEPALAHLLAAPALERIALRAELEDNLARLIADNIPEADALVQPAVAAMGWEGAARHANWAIATVQYRAAELAAEARAAAPQGFFNRLSKWNVATPRLWVFGLILLVQILRLAFADSNDTPPVNLPQVVPGQDRPVALLTDSWFRPEDRLTGLTGVAAQVLSIAEVTADRDGNPVTCKLLDTPPAAFAKITCSLLLRRARFVPNPALGGDSPARLIILWQRTDDGSYRPQWLDPAKANSTLAAMALAEASKLRPLAPECPKPAPPQPGKAQPPIACSPDNDWLSTSDFPQERLMAAGTRSLDIEYTIGRDGYIRDCRVTAPSRVQAVDDKVCSLLQQRAHFVPGHDAQGRRSDWTSTYVWGWTIITRKVDAPGAAPTADLKLDLPKPASVATDCLDSSGVPEGVTRPDCPPAKP
ncbi:MAG: hypothetical protein CFE37_09115 [Alphaproteobacteria bacterium PA4]|nr:MAG: hypothetical protein CFE37_09115 [Alphaproteobacteria bacterium PA4]